MSTHSISCFFFFVPVLADYVKFKRLYIATIEQNKILDSLVDSKAPVISSVSSLMHFYDVYFLVSIGLSSRPSTRRR